MRRPDADPGIPTTPRTEALPRILKTMIALALAFSMSTAAATCRPVAWAVDAAASIQIEGAEDGAEVNAYRIISVNRDEDTLAPEDPMFRWVPEVQDWVRSQFSNYIDEEGNVTGDFDDDLSDSGELVDHRPAGAAASFYSELAAAVSSGSVRMEPAGKRIGSGEIDGMEPGGYLVLAGRGLKVYRPGAVALVPVWNDDSGAWSIPDSVSVVLKASEVPIVKTVNGSPRDAAKAGEEVVFEISASVPVYPDEAQSTSYSISDTLPAGLTFIPETLKVFGVASSGETELSEESHYLDRKMDGEAFRLDFLYEAISRYESIRVEYAALTNEDVVVGPEANTNEAVVRYSNDPLVADSSAENTSEATVVTYGIEILKVDDGRSPLEGAEFALAAADDPSTVLGFVRESPGRYRLALPQEQGETTLKTDEDGALFIEGVDRGEYLLTETKAPDGYLRAGAPVPVTVADEDGDGSVDGFSQTPGFAFLEVRNTKGFTLPATGGVGLALVAGVGVVSIASAAVLRVASSKRKTDSLR